MKHDKKNRFNMNAISYLAQQADFEINGGEEEEQNSFLTKHFARNLEDIKWLAPYLPKKT